MAGTKPQYTRFRSGLTWITGNWTNVGSMTSMATSSTQARQRAQSLRSRKCQWTLRRHLLTRFSLLVSHLERKAAQRKMTWNFWCARTVRAANWSLTSNALPSKCQLTRCSSSKRAAAAAKAQLKKLDARALATVQAKNQWSQKRESYLKHFQMRSNFSHPLNDSGWKARAHLKKRSPTGLKNSRSCIESRRRSKSKRIWLNGQRPKRRPNGSRYNLCRMLPKWTHRWLVNWESSTGAISSSCWRRLKLQPKLSEWFLSIINFL